MAFWSDWDPDAILKRARSVFESVEPHYAVATAALAFIVSFLQSKLGAKIFFAVVLFCFFTAYYLAKRRPLGLKLRWQAVAWTHYRKVLAEAAAKSWKAGGRSGLDFVLYTGAEFEGLGERHPLVLELQQVKGAHPGLDLVIADVEQIAGLREGVSFGDDVRYRPAYLDGLLPDWRKLQAGVPDHIGRVIGANGQDPTGIPMRWGYNGIATRLPPLVEKAIKDSLGAWAPGKPFQLDWLTDPGSPVYQAIAHSVDDETCEVLCLDWYQSVMPLLAWRISPTQPNRLEPHHVKQMQEKLEHFGRLVRRRRNVIPDPMLLSRVAVSSSCVIVPGAGHWLGVAVDSMTSVERDLEVRPIGINGTPAYMLWCECLVFLERESSARTAAWTADAQKLSSWIARERKALQETVALPGLAPLDARALDLIKDCEIRVRDLPPRQAATIATRDDWKSTWHAWREGLAT